MCLTEEGYLNDREKEHQKKRARDVPETQKISEREMTAEQRRGLPQSRASRRMARIRHLGQISIHLHLLDFKSFSPPLPGLPTQLPSSSLFDQQILSNFQNNLPPLSSTWPFRKSYHHNHLSAAHLIRERRPDRPEFEWPEILGAIALALLELCCLLPNLGAPLESSAFQTGARTTVCLPVASITLGILCSLASTVVGTSKPNQK